MLINNFYVNKDLKKVDPNMKNKPVEDGPRKVSSTKTAKKFVQQETAPKKPPKKFMTGSNWFVVLTKSLLLNLLINI